MSLEHKITDIPIDELEMSKCAYYKPSTAWQYGYSYGLQQAATLAAEADELMREMADALISYAWIEDAEGEGANVANNALNSYYKYKEKNNGQ